jgi:hypothetical protein
MKSCPEPAAIFIVIVLLVGVKKKLMHDMLWAEGNRCGMITNVFKKIAISTTIGRRD